MFFDENLFLILNRNGCANLILAIRDKISDDMSLIHLVYGILTKVIPQRYQPPLRNKFGRDVEPELRALNKIIQKGDTVLDIGANRGTYTFVFQKLVGQNGLVLAFEPFELEFIRLQKSFGHKGNIRLYSSAVSNSIGTKFLHVQMLKGKSQNGSGSLSNSWDDDAIFQVNSITIDSLYLPKCSFIKIDVEGHELEVIEGAFRTLKRNSPSVLLEINSPNDHKSQKLLDYLCNLGYKIHIENNGKFIEIPTSMDLATTGKNMFYFSKSNKS